MPDGQVLEFSGVTKRFGAIAAVSDFSARVEPGQVTGFLGPNGAGKTTSLRMLLGLVRPTSGSTAIGGVPYAKLSHPLQTVGAVLEASSFHPGRTAANHLRVYARAAKISDARVDEVLALVGLSDAAGRKVGGYSLGMRQRLGLAYALLGDPGVLVLDEPSNGLDPEGIVWMRGFLRQLAREGRTVLVSSHLLTEVQQTVDALLVISQGRLVFQGGLDELADPSEYATVVDAPDRAALVGALSSADVPYEVLRSGITVRNITPAEVGVLAADAGVALSSLQRKGPALEEVFLELVSGARVHASAQGSGAQSSSAASIEDAAVAPVAAAAVADAAEPATDVAEPVVEEQADVVETPAEADSGVDPAAADVSVAEESATAAETDLDAQSAAGPAAAAVAVGTAAAFATSADGQTEATATEDESAAIDLDAPHAFAVAATGVIDVVPPSTAWDAETDGAEVDAGPEVDASAESHEQAEPPPAPPEPSPFDRDPEPEPDGLATDDFPEPAPTAPVDADPDVEALGDVDDELSSPAADESSDPLTDERPFDTYDKTESDVEADAFFSAFDEAKREAAAREADAATAPSPVASSPPAESAPPAQEPESAGASVDSETREETEQFGSLVDLDPEWTESADTDHRDENEGGEQR